MPPEHERRNMGRIGVQASHKLWLARLLVGTSALSLMGAAQAAMAQESADDTVADGDAIVVTGIRASLAASDRKSVVEGKSVAVRVGLGGRRILTKKNNTEQKQ